MQIEPDDAAQHRGFGDVDGSIDRRERRRERVVLHRCDQDRSHAAARADHGADDVRTLGDEEAAVGLDAPP